MRKIVINACHGGFSLSPLGEKLYAEKSGFQLFFYKQTKFNHRDGVNEFARIQPIKNEIFYCSMKKDLGAIINEIPDGCHWSSRDIKRDDQILIDVVNELGVAADARFAKLKTVSIPNGVKWTIEEYDGSEWVAEAHRTWQ